MRRLGDTLVKFVLQNMMQMTERLLFGDDRDVKLACNADQLGCFRWTQRAAWGAASG